MDVPGAAAAIRSALLAAADPQRAEQQRRYLKSDAEHWGVSVPRVRQAIAAVGPVGGHDDLMHLVELLWESGVFEERLAAALLLDRHANQVRAEDLELIEGLVRESATWALVDVLVPRPLAAVDGQDPVATTVALDRWVVDNDFWVRRSALLAHLIELRAGRGNWDRFAGYADALLADREFFVRKAIGWVLRDTGRKRPDLVRDWVAPRTGRISGVAVREAVKPLAQEDAAAILAAYRAGVAGE